MQSGSEYQILEENWTVESPTIKTKFGIAAMPFPCNSLLLNQLNLPRVNQVFFKSKPIICYFFYFNSSMGDGQVLTHYICSSQQKQHLHNKNCLDLVFDFYLGILGKRNQIGVKTLIQHNTYPSGPVQLITHPLHSQQKLKNNLWTSLIYLNYILDSKNQLKHLIF